jgi:hypothetical protein
VVTHQRGGASDEVQVFSVDGTPQFTMSAHSADEVFSAGRIGTADVGVFFAGPGAEARLLVIGDGSPSSDDITPWVVGMGTDYPGFEPLLGSFRGMMTGVPTGGLDDWSADMVISYQNTGGEYVAAFSRFDGTTVVPWTRVTNTNEGLTSDDVAPRIIKSVGGTTYAFLGDDVVRALELDANVTAPIASRPIGPSTERLFDVFPTAYGYANIAMFSVATNIRLFFGAVDNADMSTFVIDDLIETASYATAADLPVGPEGTMRWHGDVALWIGAEDDNGTNMAYVMFDNEGNERASGTLPFTAILPAAENRNSISELDVALRSEEVTDEGATFHVAWVENHTRNGVNFAVIYYDRLRCAPR